MKETKLSLEKLGIHEATTEYVSKKDLMIMVNIV